MKENKEEVTYGVTEEDVATSLEDINTSNTLEDSVEELEEEVVTEESNTEVLVEDVVEDTVEVVETTYVPPVVEATVEPVVEEPTVAKQEEQAPAFKQEVDVVKPKQMVQSNSQIVTIIMLERIDKHIKHLTGKLGFNDKKEQEIEQISFMETMGNVLKLDYERFCLVTDKLIEEIRANEKVFTEGLAFRYMKGLDAKYPLSVIETYQTYITFLTRVASNWSKRHQLKNMIDINHVVADLNKTAKVNVRKYFDKLTSN